MTELGLVVGIDVVGLIFALMMWRDVSVRDAGPSAVRRLAGALERAVRVFLWQEYRLVAGATLVLTLLCAGAGVLLAHEGRGFGRLESVFWTAAGLWLGAFGASLSGHLASVLAVRGSGRVAAAAATRMNDALVVGMRATGAAALFGETLCVLSTCGLLGLIYAVKGGFALPSVQALPLAQHAVSILPSFALGATLAALVMQRGGGTFHAASGVGADQAGERDAGLHHDDPRNPAAIAELVGDHVGASATRVVDAFASSSVANCAALVIGSALAATSTPNDPLLLPLLPLVLRAFGVIASGFGTFLVRSEEESSLRRALFRGYASTATIALVGIAGTSFWLFGEHFLPVCVAGALGIVSVLLAAQVSSLRFGRWRGAFREANDGLRLNGGALIAAGLGAGLESTILPVSIVGLAALLVSRLAESAFPGCSGICALVFVLSALSLAPFVVAVAALGPIADGARGAATMSNANPDLRRRTARLDDAAFSENGAARRYGLISGTLSALLVAWALGELSGTATPATSALEGSVLTWSGAVGAAVVLAYTGSVARAAVRAAREVSIEVERQLRGFPRENGVAQVPPNFTPSYKRCVEVATAASLSRALLPIAGALLTPLGLGLLLRALYQIADPTLISRGLISFVVVGTLTALTGALCLDTARSMLGALRRTSRLKGGSLASPTSTAADSLSDIFGNAAAPALQLLVKATAAAALVVTHFLI